MGSEEEIQAVRARMDKATIKHIDILVGSINRMANAHSRAVFNMPTHTTPIHKGRTPLQYARGALKNYTDIGEVNTIGRLMRILHNSKSIYHVPSNKVMPCKFFINSIWSIDRLSIAVENKEFIEVVRKDNRQRMRNALRRSCPRSTRTEYKSNR